MIKKKYGYIKVKEWTILKGIVCTLMMQLILMIPILNMSLFADLSHSIVNSKGEFWEGAWYDYKTKKVELVEKKR